MVADPRKVCAHSLGYLNYQRVLAGQRPSAGQQMGIAGIGGRSTQTGLLRN